MLSFTFHTPALSLSHTQTHTHNLTCPAASLSLRNDVSSGKEVIKEEDRRVEEEYDRRYRNKVSNNEKEGERGRVGERG